MNLSLRNRVGMSFIVSVAVILVLSFSTFHFLSELNRQIDEITSRTNRVSLLTDEIRVSATSILRYQRQLMTTRSQDASELLADLCESFTSQLQTLDSLYLDPEVKTVIGRMLSYVDSLKLVISKASLFRRDSSGIASSAELADKILDAFAEFQDIQHFQAVERNKKIKSILKETKRQMMITLIIGFFGTIIIGLIVPGKIALPFKKIKDAIRELQECNFDVSIYYTQNDEIGEIATEMNKMISSVKKFEELRTDRIGLENRKFDALANLSKRPVLVANAEEKLVYMNNRLYDLLQVKSEDVIGKDLREAAIPSSIIESYSMAIKRRSKIENAEVVIYGAAEVPAEGEEALPPPEVFQGYANIIPIRGKDSSLDYYLMVLSMEVFV